MCSSIYLAWNNVFEKEYDAEAVDNAFMHLGTQFHQLYKLLEGSEPIKVSLTYGQQERFNRHFEEVQKEYAALFGLDFVASVRRLGLITYRIAMILTILRILDNGEKGLTMICNDTDFNSALTISKVLLSHTVYIYEMLQCDEQEKNIWIAPHHIELLDLLPHQFTRKNLLECAGRLEIIPKTADKIIASFIKKGKVVRHRYGTYQKTETERLS